MSNDILKNKLLFNASKYIFQTFFIENRMDPQMNELTQSSSCVKENVRI